MKSILVIGGAGYIGSQVVSWLKRTEYKVASVDLELFGKQPQNIKHNFKFLFEPYLRSFDVVIHLAGHSSAPWCKIDPVGSMFNNIWYFTHLYSKMREDQILIYASSASVYGNCGNRVAKESDELPKAIVDYDQQKQWLDTFMSLSYRTYYGLRFGTVCGASTVPRNELLINAMVASAATENKVVVTSCDSYRAVLGMNDLVRAIETIIEKRPPAGIYNLASFNMSIGEIGRIVSDKFRSNFASTKAETTPYSFCIDTTKFCEATNFQFLDTPESIIEGAATNDFTVKRQWQILSL